MAPNQAPARCSSPLLLPSLLVAALTKSSNGRRTSRCAERCARSSLGSTWEQDLFAVDLFARCSQCKVCRTSCRRSPQCMQPCIRQRRIWGGAPPKRRRHVPLPMCHALQASCGQCMPSFVIRVCPVGCTDTAPVILQQVSGRPLSIANTKRRSLRFT